MRRCFRTLRTLQPCYSSFVCERVFSTRRGCSCRRNSNMVTYAEGSYRDVVTRVALDRHLASDFERYCSLNSPNFSLVNRSGEGYSSATRRIVQNVFITQGKDVVHKDELESLDWDGLETFYLTSSLKVKFVLQEANIYECVKEAPTYTTDIETCPVGLFRGKLLVTMYPIASELLQKTVEQTASVGVPPVHIGDPTDIGILDLQASYSGSTTLLNNGDIPVFWPSLMTIQEAVQRAGPALAYVGSTASDFSLAMPVNESSHKIHLSMLHKEGQPFCASVVSQSSVKAVNNLEDCLITGSWRKGVKELQSFTRGNLLQAAVSLSHSKHVAVTTGFPCLTHLSPPDETDGPPGILAIVRSLIACGKQVTVIVDHKNSFLRQTIEEALKKFVPHSQDVIVVPYPPSSVDECDTDTARKFLFDQSTGKATFDHLVALERTGPNYEGRYMTMTAKDISRLCDPVDQLFTLSSQEIIKTVAVGDGGNEVGFGKLRSEVGQFVDLGDQIACVVPADHLIVSGVSNWGGYALAAALCCLRRCPLHAPYVNRGIGGKDVQTSEFMPSANEERDLLAFLMKAGMRDGILPDQMMSVDGKSFDDYHAAKIREIWKIADGD